MGMKNINNTHQGLIFKQGVLALQMIPTVISYRLYFNYFLICYMHLKGIMILLNMPCFRKDESVVNERKGTKMSGLRKRDMVKVLLHYLENIVFFLVLLTTSIQKASQYSTEPISCHFYLHSHPFWDM